MNITPEELSRKFGEGYDAGYKKGVADTLAGQPYDVDNECAMVLPGATGPAGCDCRATIARMLETLRLAEKYLVDRHIESIGTTGRTIVLPAIREAIQLAEKNK